MAYTHPEEVIFEDVDMMGHVNNAQYFTFFETARTNYLLELTDAKPPYSAANLEFIVARATCDFRRGLRWGEKIRTVVWPSKIGETSFVFSYVILDAAGKVAAEGETVQVSFDYAKNAKMPIPPKLRKRLEADLKKGPGVALSR